MDEARGDAAMNDTQFILSKCDVSTVQLMHVYEVRPRGVDLFSDVLPFGRLWYAEPNAIGNATADCRRDATYM
jgi:hypothetical protein